MRRLELPSLDLLQHRIFAGTSLISFALLIGCAIPANHVAAVKRVVGDFVSEWNRGDVRRIYHDSAPQLRELLPKINDWTEWKGRVDQRRGSLRQVKILAIDRRAPAVDVYSVRAEMLWDRGTITGTFVIGIEQKGARLAGLALENASNTPPKNTVAQSAYPEPPQ